MEIDKLIFSRKDMLLFKKSKQTLGEWVVENYKKKRKILKIGTIKQIVADEMEVEVQEMESKRRYRYLALPRHLAMFFSKEYSTGTLEAIGKKVAGRDHATVLHSIKTVNNLVETDKAFRKKFEEINYRLLFESR